jgi:hypothetical protein
MIRGTALFEAAHQHGYVSPLTTAVGVELVEDQKAQATSGEWWV